MQKVVVIGAGNVAWHLAPAIDKFTEVVQVYARRPEQAMELAARLKQARAVSDLGEIDPEADLYLICVADKAIAPIAQAMPKVRGIVVHTSGSTHMHSIAEVSENIGVLYPLQTFTKDAEVAVESIPFFTEGSNADVLKTLDQIAEKIAPQGQVNHADSEQRKQLHVAAVFGCNFANHMWAIAAQLLGDSGYDFSVLHPLIEATLVKAEKMPPAQAQTGPAIRGDANTMNAHLAILPEDLQALYQAISQSIQKNKSLDD